jgi:mono/diheme cytochrome c family protein
MTIEPNHRFRTLATIALVVAVVFIALQFFRPALTNPPVTAEIQVPPEVKQVLQHSCYNCHSNETKLPWFDQVVPPYWLVAHDVKEARSHLNFSEIGKVPPPMQKAILFEAVNQIQLGAMPLPAYKRVHPDAVVTDAQLKILRDYLAPLTPNKPASADDIAKADTQYDKWIESGSKQLIKVQPTLDGFAFIPGYKNWKEISSTDRFDNHTMRVILGNDVAIKAIAEHHINPWPDGTAFAKVAFFQQPDNKGFIHTGAFQQVELMLKNSHKYAATAGWGWGRWRGDDLKPYGKDAAFSGECVSCHTPVAANDFVYTMPLKGQQ